MTNLKTTAAYIVATALKEKDTLEEIQEYAREAVHQAAEDECIYTKDCLDITSEYETEFGNDSEDDGCTYASHEWTTALRNYAIQIAKAALDSYVAEELTKLEEAFKLVSTEVERLGGDPDAIKLGGQSHGWAAHNYETAEGVMVWSNEKDHPSGAFNPRLLEGELIAVQIDYNRMPLSICWTPETVEV